MMNRKTIVIIALIAMMVLNVWLVLKLTRKGHRGKKHGPRNMVVERLNLDEKQIAQYEKYIVSHREEISLVQAEVDQIKSDLYSQLTKEDHLQAQTLAAQIGEHEEQIEMIHFQHFLDIKALCREDQLDQFDALSGELSQLFTHGHRKK